MRWPDPVGDGVVDWCGEALVTIAGGRVAWEESQAVVEVRWQGESSRGLCFCVVVRWLQCDKFRWF